MLTKCIYNVHLVYTTAVRFQSLKLTTYKKDYVVISISSNRSAGNNMQFSNIYLLRFLQRKEYFTYFFLKESKKNTYI